MLVNKSLAKKINTIFVATFFILMVLSSLAWFNNLSISKQWYDDIVQGELYSPKNRQVIENEEIETGIKDEHKDYKGPIPFLDWAAVDNSTISTFIPFFGLLFIWLGFLKVHRGGFIKNEFPFFVSYSAVMVALGLIGTMWGIIMIGYYPQEQVEMTDLIMCLHTSLYSSLVAVFWVFLIALPIKYMIQKWHFLINGLETVGQTDTVKLFEKLNTAIYNASTNLESIAKKAQTTENQLVKIVEPFSKLIVFLNGFDADLKNKIFDPLHSVCLRLEKSLNKKDTTTQEWQAAATRATTILETLKTEALKVLSSQNQVNEQNLQKISQLTTEKTTLSTQVGHVKNLLDEAQQAVENKIS